MYKYNYWFVLKLNKEVVDVKPYILETNIATELEAYKSLLNYIDTLLLDNIEIITVAKAKELKLFLTSPVLKASTRII